MEGWGCVQMAQDPASAPGFTDGVGTQGTFPSTERIRVRWAAPVRGIENGTCRYSTVEV
jgi:hypothetical protein